MGSTELSPFFPNQATAQPEEPRGMEELTRGCWLQSQGQSLSLVLSLPPLLFSLAWQMPSDPMLLWGHLPEVWQARGRLTSGLRGSSQGWCHQRRSRLPSGRFSHPCCPEAGGGGGSPLPPCCWVESHRLPVWGFPPPSDHGLGQRRVFEEGALGIGSWGEPGGACFFQPWPS